jgi:hypothetical protein
LFHTRNGQHNESIELQEDRSAVVDVPLAESRPVSSLFLSRTFDYI